MQKGRKKFARKLQLRIDDSYFASIGTALGEEDRVQVFKVMKLNK